MRRQQYPISLDYWFVFVCWPVFFYTIILIVYGTFQPSRLPLVFWKALHRSLPYKLLTIISALLKCNTSFDNPQDSPVGPDNLGNTDIWSFPLFFWGLTTKKLFCTELARHFYYANHGTDVDENRAHSHPVIRPLFSCPDRQLKSTRSGHSNLTDISIFLHLC